MIIILHYTEYSNGLTHQSSSNLGRSLFSSSIFWGGAKAIAAETGRAVDAVGSGLALPWVMARSSLRSKSVMKAVPPLGLLRSSLNWEYWDSSSMAICWVSLFLRYACFSGQSEVGWLVSLQIEHLTVTVLLGWKGQAQVRWPSCWQLSQ